LYLKNDEQAEQRPLPAPHAILSSKSSGPVSYALVSDFSRAALASDDSHVALFEEVSRLAQTALFHWPNYSLDGNDPLDDRIFEIASKHDVRLLVPGETIDARAVVILQPEPLAWLPDSIPTFKCRSVFVVDDKVNEVKSNVFINDAIWGNIESVFGHAPLNLSLADFQEMAFKRNSEVFIRTSS